MEGIKKAICFLFCALIIGVGRSQSTDSLRSKFDDYRNSTLQEKVYLLTDNDTYVTGEYMWLKAWVVDASMHRPLDFSQVLYVELVDNTDTPVLQAKLPVNPPTGETAVYLPATINSGKYVLRAYTNWMKNFSPDFYFHKPVTVINTFKKLDSPSGPARTQSFEFQLFPEGGYLINGVESKVAFKINDQEGQGLSYRGWVLAGRDTVVRFTPMHSGMGQFSITPDASRAYTVQVINDAKKVSTFPFPQIRSSGYSFCLREDRQGLEAIVTARDVTAGGVYLFVHARNTTVKVSYEKLNVGYDETPGVEKAVFRISKADLPDGISHFTVFDETLTPRCERLWFQRPTRELNFEVAHDTIFRTREKVELRVTPEVDGKATSGDYAIAVYLEDELGPASDQGIHEYFWLSSDLKGFIEQPEFYFSDHPEARQAAENLMLTQGWRRFNWDHVLGEVSPLIFLPEHYGHLVAGKVLDPSGSPVPGVLTYLSAPGKPPRLFVARSNVNGEVQFQTKDLIGAGKIIIQTQDPLQYSFTLDSPFSSDFSDRPNYDLALTSEVQEELQARSLAMQVQHVYGAGPRLAQTLTDTLSFYGKADDSYLLDDYTRFPVMEEVLREYVPKVRVRRSRDEFRFIVTDLVNETLFRDDPLVLIDGVPCTATQIMKVDPLNVRKLDVVARRYYLGALKASGIVSFSTYRGDLSGFELDPRLFSVNYQGLENLREFYSPAYERLSQKSSRIPDYRRLLYWNSHFGSSDDGTDTLEFFTSDIRGKFKVVVEGLTGKGVTGRTVTSFQVR